MTDDRLKLWLIIYRGIIFKKKKGRCCTNCELLDVTVTILLLQCSLARQEVESVEKLRMCFSVLMS